MSTTSASSPAPAVLASPDELDLVAGQTVELGRRIEAVGTAVAAVLREIPPVLPGSAAAATAPDAGRHLAELLQAEGRALVAFGRALADSAAAYRANESRLAGLLQGSAR
ncbi:MAG TPA: hypothetical protein VIJ54_05390 [Actinomycetes bacterium]